MSYESMHKLANMLRLMHLRYENTHPEAALNAYYLRMFLLTEMSKLK